MSRFPTSDSIIGKALQVTPTADNAIDARSAWLFENQTGTLGTNLNGSVLYVSEVTGAAAAVKADVAVILAGVHGLLGTVTALDATDPYGSNPSYNALSNGSGYFTATGVETTVTSTVPKSPAQSPGFVVATRLTVDIVANVPGTNASTPGEDYTVSPFTTTGGSAGSSGLQGNILAVDAGTEGITSFEITRGGQGYAIGDVLTFVSGDGFGGTMTLSSAPNGAITSIVPSVAGNKGQNYSPGDIITVVQAGASGGTRAVLAVLDLPPVIGDAVVFKNVPMGTILPVSIDYFMATGSTANIVCIAGK